MDIPPSSIKLPIGIADFRNLREDKRLYVDKSAFISEVLRDHAVVLLVPRPRRFGKTLNLSLLRYFLEKRDEDLSELFDDLVVWQDVEARVHFQKYPTIFMTFKDIKEGSFEDTFEAIQDLVRQVYHEHRYVLDAPELTLEQKDRYRRLLRSEGSKIMVRNALRDLTEYLYLVHQKQVVLLLDEYDTPIQQGYLRGFYDEAIDFFRNFYAAALKDNVYLFRGILTGILRVARESLFSGLNNVRVRSLLDPEYATSFGFTEAEILHITGAEQQESLRTKLKAWYDGYQFGGQVIYNPWSILCYLDTRRFDNYWVSTSSDDIIYDLLAHRGYGLSSDVERLLQGENIQKRIDEHLSLRDLDHRPDVVWSFLLFSGYLKPCGTSEEAGTQLLNLAIPNHEVRLVFLNVFRTWLSGHLGGDDHSRLLQDALLGADTETAERLLEHLMLSVSYHDVNRHQPEKFYHGLILGLLVNMEAHYVVRSNRESGYGRADVLLIPREPGHPGVVLELKSLDTRREESVDEAVKQALRQIRDRDYAAELRSAGAQPIHELAIVFDGKLVWVRTQDADV
ncbi:MAG: hypothetical protein ETSY1_04185 [Candidatus Entotheonella factor]|uniref:AAA-ATPase-like domain-containing protein n=1 Tax=Entotheonella factor TaxID=1429438 RepID=W4LW12_ENTF1|nr:MAG: hypothetical protein ETSY1_04185 [Candidatus Entotheonella factor]